MNKQISAILLMLQAVGCASPPPIPPSADRDQGIRAAVVAAITEDDRPAPAGLEVRVSLGVVEISGTVASIEAVRRVLRRAGQVDGVRSIVNRLRVVARRVPPLPGSTTGG